MAIAKQLIADVASTYMNALLASVIVSAVLTVAGLAVYLLTGELLILGVFLIFPSFGGLRALWRLIRGQGGPRA